MKFVERGGADANSREQTAPTTQHRPELAANGQCVCASCVETAAQFARLKKRSRDLDDLFAKLWRDAGKQFEQLRQKYPLHVVQHMMPGVVATAHAQALKTGEYDFHAAVRGAEAQHEMYARDESIRRLKGQRQSAKRRRSENVPRDRRIHDASKADKPASVIAKTEKLSPSQVRKILKKPRP